jgi:hypothetical protein
LYLMKMNNKVKTRNAHEGFNVWKGKRNKTCRN